MSHSPLPTHFQPCRLCKQRFGEQLAACPVLQSTPSNLEYLRAETPFSEWLSPQALGERYNYSAKHVLRLAQMMPEEIVAVNIQGRWFIFRCSFEQSLNR
jgi:hypothetical protein